METSKKTFAARPQVNMLAIWALVVALLVGPITYFSFYFLFDQSLFLNIVTYIFMVGLPVLAIILSVKARRQIKQTKQRGRGVALAAMIIAITIFVLIAAPIAFFGVITALYGT